MAALNSLILCSFIHVFGNEYRTNKALWTFKEKQIDSLLQLYRQEGIGVAVQLEDGYELSSGVTTEPEDGYEGNPKD